MALKKHILATFEGRRALQSFFEGLQRVALRGMHYGAGSDEIDTSGERGVIDRLAERSVGRARLRVFDVGANVGDYTKALLDRFQRNVDVFAFEPARSSFDRLTQRWSNHDNVHLFQLALGQADETLPLYSDREASSMASLYQRRMGHVGRAFKLVEQVTVSRLDSFCSLQEIPRIDLMKIDVEGHELSVLRGAGALLTTGAIEMIQFEFGRASVDARVFMKDFFELLGDRYAIYRVVCDGLAPIRKYHEALEVFLTTNYVAIWRGN
jgi:FkbM family methyltransferase